MNHLRTYASAGGVVYERDSNTHKDIVLTSTEDVALYIFVFHYVAQLNFAHYYTAAQHALLKIICFKKKAFPKIDPFPI